MADNHLWNDMPDYDDSSYDAAAEADAQNYLEEHFPLTTDFVEYKSESRMVYTIDEYLMCLIKGYYNVSLRAEYDKYLMELLEDQWFHQWPLVRQAYALRLLEGRGCRKNVKQAVDLLLHLVEEDCPGTMYHLGRCYMEGLGLEQSYEKAIICWIKAGAQSSLSAEYWSGQYHQLEEAPSELMLDFLCQVKEYFLKSRGIHNEKDIGRLDAEDSKNYKRLCNQVDKAKKTASKKARLHEIGSFFWTEEENPYSK